MLVTIISPGLAVIENSEEVSLTNPCDITVIVINAVAVSEGLMHESIENSKYQPSALYEATTGLIEIVAEVEVYPIVL